MYRQGVEVKSFSFHRAFRMQLSNDIGTCLPGILGLFMVNDTVQIAYCPFKMNLRFGCSDLHVYISEKYW